jgi:hypothetical protein
MSRSASRVLTRVEILSLPRPTGEQLNEFAAHVCWAHSWYKHLSLLTGGEFVFFLASDAGEGYPPESPRLHYSWKTTPEYRERFGFLDYAYSTEPETCFERDARPCPELPTDLVAATRTVLHPFASSDFNAPQACLWDIHADAVESMRAGHPHPLRSEVLNWVRTQEELAASWETLPDAERELALGDGLSEAEIERLPVNAKAHLRNQAAADEVYDRLQRGEATRVRDALGRLTALVAGWRAEEK